MDRFILEKLVYLLKTGIFQANGDSVEFFYRDPDQNPLYQSLSLRQKLIEESDKIDLPYIYCDEFHIYYACIKTEKSYFLVGPMPTEYLNRFRRHEFFKAMNVELDLEKNLRLFTIVEVLQTVSLLAKLFLGKEYTDLELVAGSQLKIEDRSKIRKDAILYDIKVENSDEDYRHSYQEEKRLLSAVREGNVEEALKRNKALDVDIGRLSQNDISHWRNVLVIGVTLCTRAAIEGGVAPYLAYRISGFYINKGSATQDILQILSYRNQAVEELAREVQGLKVQRHTSSYTQQCKDYIRRHYREKIYLDALAEEMGISSSYLSRLFKKETGYNLQDYVVEVRIEKAANLLVYSDESISGIAEYVNFPSQSYFGRIFKEKKHMTPREYREAYKPSEFIDKKLP